MATESKLDAKAVWAASEAFRTSRQRYHVDAGWPGTAHIEAAIKAFLAVVGSRVVPERRKQTKDRRVTLERRGRVTATLDRRQA